MDIPPQTPISKSDIPPSGPVESFAQKSFRLADDVAQALDADVFLYSGPVESPKDVECVDLCASGRSIRNNVFLILSTFGGDPHAGYRIARALARRYSTVIICIDGHCASAGTLIALAAHELVMSDHAMLGPLDTQIAKSDELWEMNSGLTGLIAFDALQRAASQAFEKTLVNIKMDLPNQVTLKTAMEMSAKLTIGLFEPIYAQIDPLKLGEDQRALEIAEHYGRRLLKKSRNLKSSTLSKLLASYPSHSFVIDKEEAKELFVNVREPSVAEAILLDHLKAFTREPQEQAKLISLSSKEQGTTTDDDDDGGQQEHEGHPQGGVPPDGRRPEASNGSGDGIDQQVDGSPPSIVSGDGEDPEPGLASEIEQ